MKKKIKKLIIKKARASRYDVDCDPFLEEVIVNSEEIYDGLIASGKSSREAYQLTIKQIGDLDEYFNDKSVDDSCTFTRQRTIHNILSGSLILAAILLVGLYYIIEIRPPWMYIVVNLIIIGIVVYKKIELNSKILIHRIFKNNVDRRFYFCLLSNLFILLPIVSKFSFLQYLGFVGIILFVINVAYLLIVDQEIKPSFLLSIIALIFSIIHLSYSVYSIILIFFMAILVFTGIFYIKAIIKYEIYEYIFIFLGSVLILLMLFFMEYLKLFELLFVLMLIMTIIYILFNKKNNSIKKTEKIKAIISLFIVIHILAINLFILTYYIINFRNPEFIPYQYTSLLYRPTITCILLEYLNIFINNLVLNHVYKKKGV